MIYSSLRKRELTARKLKSLYIFAVQNREIEENPIHNIKIDKAEKKLPQILTGKEVELLLQQPKVTEMKGCRDKAMLEVLYAVPWRYRW